ncbi:uncharacterized protein TRUGW13939_02938 [Talaromyces rugulosus]|uniref:Uncharacterized protein n=1 Tax=Talaromyces rugulosus TaxID=121627 RepID=A0A7H8QPE7_TALRU|nr:uncharacterized protein TRUGW13939_02938 [Talaromyces rugulosus]QKX55840.1 hypothetical protein TRUGW13939_02938 [Talaromyces rugulosus]
MLSARERRLQDELLRTFACRSDFVLPASILNTIKNFSPELTLGFYVLCGNMIFSRITLASFTLWSFLTAIASGHPMPSVSEANLAHYHACKAALADDSAPAKPSADRTKDCEAILKYKQGAALMDFKV